jgi:hypothetical protein
MHWLTCVPVFLFPSCTVPDLSYSKHSFRELSGAQDSIRRPSSAAVCADWLRRQPTRNPRHLLLRLLKSQSTRLSPILNACNHALIPDQGEERPDSVEICRARESYGTGFLSGHDTMTEAKPCAVADAGAWRFGYLHGPRLRSHSGVAVVARGVHWDCNDVLLALVYEVSPHPFIACVLFSSLYISLVLACFHCSPAPLHQTTREKASLSSSTVSRLITHLSTPYIWLKRCC